MDDWGTSWSHTQFHPIQFTIHELILLLELGVSVGWGTLSWRVGRPARLNNSWSINETGQRRVAPPSAAPCVWSGLFNPLGSSALIVPVSVLSDESKEAASGRQMARLTV